MEKRKNEIKGDLKAALPFIILGIASVLLTPEVYRQTQDNSNVFVMVLLSTNLFAFAEFKYKRMSFDIDPENVKKLMKWVIPTGFKYALGSIAVYFLLKGTWGF